MTEDKLVERITKRLPIDEAEQVLSVLEENLIDSVTINAGLCNEDLQEVGLSEAQGDACLLDDPAWRQKYSPADPCDWLDAALTRLLPDALRRDRKLYDDITAALKHANIDSEDKLVAMSTDQLKAAKIPVTARPYLRAPREPQTAVQHSVPGASPASAASPTSMQRNNTDPNLLASAACPMQPLRMRVGLTESRDQRGEWKTQLEESVSLQLKERNADLDDKILRGEVMESAIRTQVEHRKRPVISFLESSTFTDTEWERNLVIADCVLYLQEFARKYGLEFRLVEMRWGIRADASSSHQTSDICMAELERCQAESQGISYVFLGAQKYGFRPPPAKIPQDVFRRLYDVMDQAGQDLLDECFRLDTNSVSGSLLMQSVMPLCISWMKLSSSLLQRESALSATFGLAEWLSRYPVTL